MAILVYLTNPHSRKCLLLATSFHYRVVSKIIFFFFLSFNTWAYSIQAPETSREINQRLIEVGLEDINNKEYASALEKFMKVELMAQEKEWDDILWAAKNQIGIIYLLISDFSKALDYFQESYVLTQSSWELYEKGATPLSNIALLYEKEKKHEEALKYYTKAYDIAKMGNNAVVRKNIVNNIANTYIELGKADKSLEILYEVEEPVHHLRTDFMWKANFIKALSLKGENEKAEKMAKQLYDELGRKDFQDPREECFICIAEVLTTIYTDLNKLDLAIEYAKKGVKNSDELTYKINFYKRIADLYHKKGEYKLAFQYKDSVLITTDSLSASINRSQYEINKVRFKVQEYQTELNAKAKQQKSERRLFTVVIIFSILLTFSIYRGLRSKIVKQKQKALITTLELEKEKKEHLLAEKHLESNKLKQQQLKHEVAEKNREFAAKALYLTKRNKLIEDIIHSLEVNSQKFDDKQIGSQIRSIKNILKSDDQQEDFMIHFERVNPVFLNQLKNKHPELTANDIRFLCYVFMNLSIKEIADILNITYNACRKRKWKIQEKMQIDKADSLYDYLFSV